MGLPQGTVTFLFTDIEGSTRLWEESPAPMGAALARHDAILEGAITSHGGVVFSRMGDGMAAAFASAREAVWAALEAQRGLAQESWPDEIGRAAVPGWGPTPDEGVLVNGQYLNQPLNRCARLMAAAHGGQVVLSGTTEPLVRGQPARGGGPARPGRAPAAGSRPTDAHLPARGASLIPSAALPRCVPGQPAGAVDARSWGARVTWPRWPRPWARRTWSP